MHDVHVQLRIASEQRTDAEGGTDECGDQRRDALAAGIEIEEDAYKDISNGDELEVNIENKEIKNLTKNKNYKMKPFSEIIGKIIEAGGLFNYKP